MVSRQIKKTIAGGRKVVRRGRVKATKVVARVQIFIIAARGSRPGGLVEALIRALAS